MTGRVLVIDDDEGVRSTIRLLLVSRGHEVDAVASGAEALNHTSTNRYDALVLDWGLPDIDGVTLLRKIRALGVTTPAVILTGRGHTADKVHAFACGADDYVVKPPDPDELVARVEAHMRRGSGTRMIVRVGRITVNESERTAFVHLQPLDLTPKEFAILLHLVRCAGQTVERAALAHQVFGDASTPGRSLDVHVARLRHKLGEAADQLETVRGRGFRLSGE
jgi:DNA-binding response OmpR family regulator